MYVKYFSSHAGNAIKEASFEAARLHSSVLGLEHLFLGILRQPDCKAVFMLQSLAVDTVELRRMINKKIAGTNDHSSIMHNGEEEIVLLTQTKRALDYAFLLMRHYKFSVLGTEHLLAAILHDNDNIITLTLQTQDVNEQKITNLIKQLPPETHQEQENKENPPLNTSPFDSIDEPDDDFDDEKLPMRLSEKSHAYGKTEKSQTPMLDAFGRDLTQSAKDGLLDPIVGREKELERIAQILSRRKKNNPILIGEPGVGKSAIAEGLAIRIIERKVSRNLINKRVVSLDIATIVAGTKYRGQFEERMKAILNELEKNTNIILFIDEIHTLVGAGSAAGSLDASNMFKPALARGEIQCIGATTLNEYRQYIEKDGALERRFQKILVSATTPEETQQILNNIKSKYEDHHWVSYTPEAIDACIKLTDRYVSDRLLPDKAIDAMDESGSRVHIANIEIPEEVEALEKEISSLEQEKTTAVDEKQFIEAGRIRDLIRAKQKELKEANKEWESRSQISKLEVSAENVAEVVAMMTGVPVQRIAQDESDRLLHIEEELQTKIIGQDDAVKKISKAIRRNRAGLKDPKRPIGTFIFLGPTGVGKTHLAKTLAEYLFDSDANMIRIDMSEYMEKFAVSRLIGAPPGYVGYEEGGQLTEKVRRRPYSIVLLDEIEKAHPDIFHLLLQVLDDGQLTDGMGRKVDFKNTIIIMTSNVGSRQLKDFGTGVGFSTATRQQNKASLEQSVIENALKKSFAPEFLNRVDDIVFFNTLQTDDVLKIIDIELNHLSKRLEQLGYSIDITLEVKTFLIDKAWDPNYGARPLKRAIQRYLEDELAEQILSTQLDPSKDILVSLETDDNGEQKIHFSRRPEKTLLPNE